MCLQAFEGPATSSTSVVRKSALKLKRRLEIATFQSEALVQPSCWMNFQMPLLSLALRPPGQAGLLWLAVLAHLVIALLQPQMQSPASVVKVMELPLVLVRHQWDHHL